MFKHLLVVLVNMKLFFLIMPLQLVATGKTETRCTADSEEELMCKFPQDVNKTQINFVVYFYPDNGGEEPLVDCVWTPLHLHCIRQKGFECQKPVSDTVVISMPNSFVHIRGHYRCIPEGYIHKEARPCRHPAVEDFAACEARSTLPGLSVTVNCTFSFPVDSFDVLWNNRTLAKYTKSLCQHSHLCHYMPSNSTDVFAVNLNVSAHPNDEFICLPDVTSIALKKCSIATTIQVKSSPACTVVARSPFVLSLALLSTMIIFAPKF